MDGSGGVAQGRLCSTMNEVGSLKGIFC